MSEPLHLFYSYNYEDEPARKKLDQHLKVLQRNGVIKAWSGRDISAGTEWKNQVDANLDQADIILLLVSTNFIASDYCYEIEMKRALERHERREARVIPVIVSPVDWMQTPIQKLQAVPENGKAVADWPNPDTAWLDVARRIRKVAQEILAERAARAAGSGLSTPR